MTMNGNARTYADVIQNVRSQIVLNFYNMFFNEGVAAKCFNAHFNCMIR